MERRKVLITGASGLIAGLAIKNLGDKYEFSGLSRRPVAGIPHRVGDISESRESIQPAFTGMHTVLHLAAANGDDQWMSWPPTMAITVQGTLNVFEAARLAGVKRIVHFSSGSTQVAWEWDPGSPYAKLANGPNEEIPEKWPMVELDWAVRPDSPYAVGKIFGEHLGRYYADKYGISTLVIRCAAVLREDRPMIRRHFASYFSHADCVQLMDKCLGAPESMLFDIFNGISENKYHWRSTEHTKKTLGWKPTGSADKFW